MPKNNFPKENEQETAIEELTYEQAFAQLEQIVISLETEEHTLDESLSLFERGQLLAQHCTALLDQSELKVKQIVGEDTIPYET